MEKDNQTSYSYDLNLDKHYFASFFNLAFDNLEAVLKLFQVKKGLDINKKIDRNSIFQTHFSPNIAPSELDLNISIISTYLPVFEKLGYETDEKTLTLQYNSEKAISDFQILINILDDLRNFYTHFEHKPIDLDSTKVDFIENRFAFLFDELVKQVKQKKMKTDKTREAFNQNLGSEILILKNLQKSELKAKKPRINPSESELMSAIINRAFSHLIEQRKPSYNERYRDFSILSSSETENGISLSESTVLFISSCFLSRNENERFRAKIKGYKAKFIPLNEDELSLEQNSLRFMATQWVFSELSYKRIRTKLDTSTVKETLLMQVLDYLSKVPNELYEVLPEKTQKTFIEDINSYYSNSKITEADKLVQHNVIRKRYEDKFNYFALRFMDECAHFSSLNFQVHLGNFIHDNREKEIKGTTFTTNRIIKEKIKCYGKLSELIDLKSDNIEKLIEKQKLKNKGVWEFYPNPSYNFIEGNIPIYLNINYQFEDAKNEFNTEKRADKKIKIENLFEEFESDKITSRGTIALLSLNEIPALLNGVLSEDNKGKTRDEKLLNGSKAMEARLKSKLAIRFNAFNKSDVNNSLPKSWNELSEEKYNLDKLESLFKWEVEEIEYRLKYLKKKRIDTKQKNIENERNKKYKNNKTKMFRVFGLNETGEIATWIAKEIVRFMPPKTRAEWKGYNHAHLQKLISMYEVQPKEAEVFLQNFLNFSQEEAVFSCFKEKEFDTFYEAFLNSRKNRFTQLLNQCLEAKTNTKVCSIFIKNEVVPFFSKRLYVGKNRNELKKRFQGMPAALARGIFDEKPTFIPGKSLEENPEEFADWFVKTSDKTIPFQKFYAQQMDFEDAFVKSLSVEEQKAYKSNPLNFANQKKRFIRKQIGTINQIKRKDVLLWELAKTLAEKLDIDLTNFDLSKIYISKQDRDKSSLGENAFIWSKTIDYRSKDGRIFQENVKLKDLGKQKRWEVNPRVCSLMKYDEEKYSNKVLESELYIGTDCYEFLRTEKVFKCIHRFEAFVLSKYSKEENKSELERKENPNFNEYLVNGYFKKMKSPTAQELDFLKNELKKENFENVPAEIKKQTKEIQKAFILVALRNKFAHNQLPSASMYELCLSIFEKKAEMTYSLYFYNCIEKIVEEFIDKVK